MPENVRMWVEISFNIAYLIVVWWLVFTMQRKRTLVADRDQRSAQLVIWAFGLLALGDTGHVGFRVWAYALGSLESRVVVFGQPVGLVGVGALATAITVTFFYVFVLELWRERFQKKYGPFEILLLIAALVRLVLMAFPMNEWNSVVPPQPWGAIRNIPLMVQGLGVAYLILRDAWQVKDRTFQWIGASILISYACYMPVIFFVQEFPLLGMLMIPKTLAYVAIGFLAYGELYHFTKPETLDGLERSRI